MASERLEVRLKRARVVAGHSRPAGAVLARAESLGVPTLEIALALQAGDAELVAIEATSSAPPAREAESGERVETKTEKRTGKDKPAK